MVALLGLLSFTFASPAQAQVTSSVEGFVGYYRPLGQFDPASVYVVGIPSRPSDMQSPVWGVTARLGVGSRMGLAAQLAMARSRGNIVYTPAGAIGARTTSIVLGSLFGQYDISPSVSKFHLRLNAGPAFVHHGGDAFREVGGATSFAPAIGTTLVVILREHLQLSAEATGLFYTFDVPMAPELRANAGPLLHGRQRDLLLHLGVAWVSGSR